MKKACMIIVFAALLMIAALSAANAEWRESGGTWRYYNEEGRQVTNFHSYGDLYIPPEVTNIQRTMLMGISRRFVICCEPGSYAEKFAKQYGFQYDNGVKRVVGTGITNVSEKVRFVIDNYITDNYTGGPLSTRQKVTVLYDWLMTNVSYSYRSDTWAVEWALIYGQGVCSSYSAAFKKMLDYLNIPSIIMQMPQTVRDGWIIDPGHAWNLVYVDGRWSHVDVTWYENTDLVDPDDPYLTTGHESYACLLLSDNAIRPIYNSGLRRTWDENIVPDEGKIGLFSTNAGIGFFMGRQYAGEWVEYNGKLYYFADNGYALPDGVREIDGKRYLILSGQAVRSAWIQQMDENNYAIVSGQIGWFAWYSPLYYVGADGVLAEGLKYLNDETYFFDEDGMVATGWLKINDDICFFGPEMVMDETVQIDGKSYTFGPDGELVSDPPPQEIKAVEINDPRKPIKAFVTRCYQLILGRSPDAHGLKTWYNELNSGRKAASEIIDNFVRSVEFKGKNHSNEESVEILYNTMLGRGSDPGGKANWVAKLDAGQPLAAVINGFCGSREFKAICDSYGIRSGSVDVPEEVPTTPDEKIKAFVKRCYQIILGRGADETGLNNWFNYLKTKQKAASEIVDGFVNSPEFLGKKYSNEESVEILYKAMLGRGSDPKGKANWVAKLNAGQPFAVVINGFCGSQEFTGLCASYGIEPGRVNFKTVVAGQSEEELAGLAYNAEEPIMKRSEANPNRVSIINPSDTIDPNIGTAVQAVYINEEKAKEFVSRCYRHILGRAATDKELEKWVGQMTNGTKTADQIARGFLFSDEFKGKNVSNEALIRILYKVYLNREADPAGLASWTAKLDSGMGLKDLLDTLVKTGEYKNVISGMGK